MVVTVFRSRLRPGVEGEYGPLAERMFALAASMPGFVGSKDYVAADGERVAVIEFASEAEHVAWRDHPEHRRVQRLGRERFYAAFRLQVCRLEKELRFP